MLVRADKIPFNHHNLKYFSLARNNVFFISFPYSIERSVGVSVWGLEDGNLLSFWGWDWVILDLNEGLGGWPRVGSGGLRGGWSDITAGLIWSSGGWVSVIMRDIIWLLSGAWSTSWAVHWSVGSGANLSIAVLSIWSVITVAFWEWSSALDNDWVPLDEVDVLLLVVVVWLTLHDDVLTEILVTIHTGGKELAVSWHAGDTLGTRVNASIDLEESTSRWHSLVPGWLVEVWISIGGDSTEEKGNNSRLHCLICFIKNIGGPAYNY